MPQGTTYSPRYATPDYIQREAAQTIELPVYRDGSLAVPSSGTVSVFDESGDAVVNEQAVTVSAGIGTHSILAATLPDTLTFSDRWQERWTLVMPDGLTYEFWRDAALVRRRLYPVVSDLDLTRLHTELRAWMAEDQSSLQNYIDSAWDAVQLRLHEAGRRPYLVMSPWSLRAVHLVLALAYTFRDYAASAGDGKYADLAEHYLSEHNAAWDRLQLVYDVDEDDVIDNAEQGLAGQPVLVTNVPGRWRWGLL